MKKIKILAALAIAGAANAQISVALKANLLFPTDSPSWKNIVRTAGNAYDAKGKNNTGFNVGLSLKTPFMGNMFLMPELYYTTFKNEFTDPVSNTTLEAKSNRLDLPVLLGYNLLGETLGVFVGPVASYNLGAKKEDYLTSPGTYAEQAKNQFTVGYQIGAQLQIRKILLNARYEGAFTKDQRDFIENVADSYSVIRFDSRPSLFIAGIGYKF